MSASGAGPGDAGPSFLPLAAPGDLVEHVLPLAAPAVDPEPSEPSEPGELADAAARLAVLAGEPAGPPSVADAVTSRFRILLPNGWLVLPLAPEGRRERIRALVRRRAGAADDLAAARYRAAAELERAAEAAVRSGSFFVAGYDELVDGVPVSASLAASVAPTGLGTLAPEADPDAAIEAMADRLATDEPDDELGAVRLPLGPAVRYRSRAGTGLRGTKGTELRTSSVQYLAPLAGSDRMLVLSFSTPTLALADRFAALFDAMARTARVD